MKTHCRYGHEFTPENTYLGANGSKVCRECRRKRERNVRVELKRLRARVRSLVLAQDRAQAK